MKHEPLVVEGRLWEGEFGGLLVDSKFIEDLLPEPPDTSGMIRDWGRVRITIEWPDKDVAHRKMIERMQAHLDAAVAADPSIPYRHVGEDEIYDWCGQKAGGGMSEITATYDAGEVRVRVDPPPTPAWVCDQLEAVWRELAGESGAWGELTAHFEGGRLRTVKRTNTLKF